ncbi:MAG: hypothetical protein IPL40_09370 [Proteobacteria bacterium]|nr:hypothetical protein [Pseudomonadota bacterium]
MSRTAPLLVLGVLTLGALGPGGARAEPPRPSFLRGVALGHTGNASRAVLRRRLGEIKALGASHVSLTVVWSMRDVRQNRLAPRPGRTPSDAELRWLMAQARALGLELMVFPIVEVERRKPLEWRGTLRPDDWRRWWLSYRRFILHYARLSARGQADVYCVGSELVSTEGQRGRWAELIAEVRQVFRGALLYSANWDHYAPVGHWDLVDMVGLTAYHQLTPRRDASEQELLASWGRLRDDLVAWARRERRRIVFTEVGYPSIDGGARFPWDYTQPAVVDIEEQRRAFSAFVGAWSNVPELAGVFVWDWYGDGGPNDRGYTPRGKPAQGVIEAWFQRAARAAPQQRAQTAAAESRARPQRRGTSGSAP